MSKKAVAAPREENSKSKSDVARPAPPVFKPPLTKRPGLFYALLGVVGVWVAFLLVLYFATVFPHRGQQPPYDGVVPDKNAVAR